MANDSADALNRALDALVQGEVVPETDIDPTLLTTVTWFHRLGGEPTPAPAFRARLEHDLMSHCSVEPPSIIPVGTTGIQSGKLWRLPEPTGSPPARLPRWRWASRAFSAAVWILVLSLIGLTFLGPLRPGSDPAPTMPAAFVPVATPAATPTATPYPMTDHLIIGVWQFDIELRQPGTDLAYFTFVKDGTFVAHGERGDWVAFGNWRATGERTAELVYVLQGIPPQDVFAADYVPAVTVFEPGVISLRLSLVVDDAGTTVTAEGEGTIYREDGTVAQTFDGDNARMIGTRMEVATTVPATPAP